MRSRPAPSWKASGTARVPFWGLDGLEAALADVADRVDPGRHFQQPVGHFPGGLAEPPEARIGALELHGSFQSRKNWMRLDQHFRLFQPADQDCPFRDPITASRGNALTGGAMAPSPRRTSSRVSSRAWISRQKVARSEMASFGSHAGGFHFSQFAWSAARAR